MGFSNQRVGQRDASQSDRRGRLRRGTKLCLFLGALVTAGVLAVLFVWPPLERLATGYHQAEVTRTLEAWGRSYSSISNLNQAIEAAGVVDYMSRFYVSGPGYHGSRAVEAALAKQREESIGAIVAALEAFTGLNYGANPVLWRRWAEAQKAASGAGESGAPADERQSIWDQTNHASGVSGARGGR
jgi:hypothetical protein